MTLEDYRSEIDSIDDCLAALFRQRMAVAAKIAAYKKEHGLAVADAAREQQKLEELRRKCPDFPEDITALYETIFSLSRGYQSRLLG